MEDGWKGKGQSVVYSAINPLINLLVKLGVTPNMITFLGLVINVLAACIFIYGAEFTERGSHQYIAIASAVILFGGLMDMVDGRLARVGGMSSDFGALYDSVLDRYSEMFMFLGICYYLISFDYFLSSLAAFIAMIGSVMVSYTRARAEGLGVNASVGIMQRPERILLIGIAGVATGIFSSIYGEVRYTVDWLPIPIFETISIFTMPIFLLAIMANATAIRRLLHSKREIAKR